MVYLKTSNSLLSPFMVWSDLAVKTGEMMVASAQVISHRTGRMATAGASPSARDQHEFRLMGQEKVEAMTESAQAMALQMMTMNPMLGLSAFELMMKSSGALLSLASSTSISQSLSRQAELGRVLAQSAKMNAELTHSAANVAHHGLEPIHSRATANAKRLNKI
jgi:hypothetical protein